MARISFKSIYCALKWCVYKANAHRTLGYVSDVQPLISVERFRGYCRALGFPD
jgi:hypothetical protein